MPESGSAEALWFDPEPGPASQDDLANTTIPDTSFGLPIPPQDPEVADDGDD